MDFFKNFSNKLLSCDFWSYRGTLLGICAALFFICFSTMSAGKSIPTFRPFGVCSFLRIVAQVLSEARKKYPGKLFRIITDLGDVVILPPDFADEIKNNPKFSFTAAFEQVRPPTCEIACGRVANRAFLVKDFHAGIPGYEISNLGGLDSELIQTIAKKQLTRSLTKITPILSEEAALAIRLNLGTLSVWNEVTIKAALLDIVARTSSRVYLGKELCHNDRWLEIAKTYTARFFMAATQLRLYPPVVRPFVHWWIPECKELRMYFSMAHQVLNPVLKHRRQLRQMAIAVGDPILKFNDAIDWVEDEALDKGVKYNPATVQLLLTTVSINTTTDLLQQCMICIAQHPDILKPLRNEIATVLHKQGWTKSSLNEMQLLDSVIKESQRVKPSSIASMRRYVMEPVTLSNGVVLNKGARTYVDSYRMWDSNLHKDPDHWDGYRFLKLRLDCDKGKMAQLVSTSPDHLAFGYGLHACPGRFFATNEIKVILCFLLMKYDWMLAPAADVNFVMNGILANANPSVRMLVRQREAMEVEIETIK
ncbi:hypothetical protein LCI18_008380 [Fusarium solani-melongenae]|uniref:Uncharacterized protein n=1 Tax=Fusarium solani subsp. cucurbitae TaxID=2747967 RepID=A0ACD3Z885_FUSSC|nr:hypothetical protein LCI18_008380 [Fusarium solani-melongenae]